MNLLYILPKKYLSFFLGWLAHIPLPTIFSIPLIQVYCAFYNVNLEEVQDPLNSFHSLGQFFVRALKSNVRPISDSIIVSPVDGTITDVGSIFNGQITQPIKNTKYSVSKLLARADKAEEFQSGQYFTLYLSPKDYHRVHSPMTGIVTSISYIPGTLWPVNSWSLVNINELFCVNERVVVYIKTELGQIAVVFIGATNVGRISLSFDDLVTNSASKMTAPWSRKLNFHKNLQDKDINIQKADELGSFHLGSTIILLMDKDLVSGVGQCSNLKRAIRYGESLTLERAVAIT